MGVLRPYKTTHLSPVVVSSCQLGKAHCLATLLVSRRADTGLKKWMFLPLALMQYAWQLSFLIRPGRYATLRLDELHLGARQGDAIAVEQGDGLDAEWTAIEQWELPAFHVR